MSEIYNSVIEHLTSPGQMFEVKDVKDSNGVVYKEYVSFPDNLKAFYDTGLLHPQDRDWLVHEDERFSYKEVYDKAAQTANALISFGIKKVIVLLYVCKIILSLYMPIWLLLG